MEHKAKLTTCFRSGNKMCVNYSEFSLVSLPPHSGSAACWEGWGGSDYYFFFFIKPCAFVLLREQLQ